jgi:hypothetical protein
MLCPLSSLQLVSNGRFRSVEHRVLANKNTAGTAARVSVATFVDVGVGRATRRYGPIQELLHGGNPPLYRSVTVDEFVGHFYRKGSERRARLDYFKLEQ